MKEISAMHHCVREEEEGKMVRQVLRNRFRFSRRMFRRLKEAKAVEVNGEKVFLTSRVYKGDWIQIRLPHDTGEGMVPQPIPVDVLYEDEDLIVLDKQPGVVVHPTKNHPDQTLANGLAHYWRERGEFHLIRPVTRLDKDTSGLIVFAKHAHAHAVLSGQMKKKRYHREYLAVVYGMLEQNEGVIRAPIARSSENSNLRVVSTQGVEAITRYRVVERLKGADFGPRGTGNRTDTPNPCPYGRSGPSIDRGYDVWRRSSPGTSGLACTVPATDSSQGWLHTILGVPSSFRYPSIAYKTPALWNKGTSLT